MRIRRPAIAAAIAVAVALPLLGAAPSQAATDAPEFRFVDCAAPTGGDGTVDRPLNSLEQVNALELSAGDHVFFKRGSTCDGSLKPRGSGEAGNPIVVDAYGDADAEKPHIRGGGVEEAVLLHNQEYWELRNLQVSNIDADTAQRYKHERRGVVIALEDFGQGDYYRVVGLDVHDVYGQGKKDLGGSGGIQLEVYANADESKRKKTWFNDVVIEDNSVENVNRSGINMSTAWKCRPENGWDGCPPADRQKLVWTPTTGLVIRGNTVKNVGGDGIVIQMNRDALVEYNTVSDVANRANGSNAGVWAWNADGTVFQYNEVFDVKRLPDNNDGNAFDADYGTTGTVFQYNYSHDNAGGMMLYCGCGGLSTKVTFRYNVSENDRNRLNFVAGGTENAFYNNTIIAPDAANFVINNTNGNGTSMLMANNLFIASKDVADQSQNNTGANAIQWRNNAFSGPVSGWPASTDSVTFADRLAPVDGEGMDRFKIRDERLAGKGIPIAEPGTRDLFGNVVPSSCRPDIGAFQFSGSADDCGIRGATITAGAEREVPVAALTTYRVTSATGAVSVVNPKNVTTVAGAAGGAVFPTTMDATTVKLTCAPGADCTDVRMSVVQNLGIDPSFESASNSPWGNWNTNRATDHLISGAKALRINGVGSSEQRVINVLPNTDYTLRGWAASTDGRPVQVGLKNFDGNQTPGDPNQKQEFASVTGAEMTQVSVPFNPGNSTVVNIYCYRPQAGGSGYCDDITLTADAAQVRAALQPAATTAREGQNATFFASFVGVDRGNVSWQQDVGGTWTDVPGAVGPALTREAVGLDADGARFRAIVHGTGGVVASEPATLTVAPTLAAASVVTGPADLNVDEGADARFAVTPAGNPAPVVQWQRSVAAESGERAADAGDWQDVEGATGAELMLTAVTADLDGVQYRAVVTNAFGAVVSEPATLSVRAAAPNPDGPGDGGTDGGAPGTPGAPGAGGSSAAGVDGSLAVTGGTVSAVLIGLAAALVAGGAVLLRRRRATAVELG